MRASIDPSSTSRRRAHARRFAALRPSRKNKNAEEETETTRHGAGEENQIDLVPRTREREEGRGGVTAGGGRSAKRKNRKL